LHGGDFLTLSRLGFREFRDAIFAVLDFLGDGRGVLRR